jgi:hypothetical protein
MRDKGLFSWSIYAHINSFNKYLQSTSYILDYVLIAEGS